MSSSPSIPDLPALSPTESHLIRHTSLLSTLAFSLLAPPLYLASTLRKGAPLSANRFLRAAWVIPVGVGAPVGAAVGFGKARWDKREAEREVLESVRDPHLLRLTDYSIIGAVLGGLIGPTLFLRRARLVNAVLGGAALGAGAGAATHWVRKVQEEGLAGGRKI